MKKGIFSCMLLGMISWTHAADITGTWRTVDDKTGYVRAHIQIEKLKEYKTTLINSAVTGKIKVV